jgi:DNA end-binding protein Ku
MRAVWKGVISFGLANIAVRLYSATEDKDIRFKSVHVGCGGGIKMPRMCTKCGEQGLASSAIGKGYETGDGLVLLDESDLADLPLSTSRRIEIEQFVTDVDPIYHEKMYYLEPDGPEMIQAYELLAHGLKGTRRIGIGKAALRQRERMVALSVLDGNVIRLTTLRWPDEVRVPEFMHMPTGESTTTAGYLMACEIIKSMAVDELDLTQYSDEYRNALERVIEAKVAGQSSPAIESKPQSNVVDLMAALRASVEKARADRQAREAATEQAIPALVGSRRATKTTRTGQGKGTEKILAPVKVASSTSRATRTPKVASQS